MNIKETVVVELEEKDVDALNRASAVLSNLVEAMDDREKEFISDSDSFGYGREEIARVEEILNFLSGNEQFTID